LRDVRQSIGRAIEAFSKSKHTTNMSTLALRLNDLAPSLPQLAALASGREMQRTIASAKQWLKGALGETAIGLFSRLYGLPLPQRLAELVAAEAKLPVAAAAVDVNAAPLRIAAESQWQRTQEIASRSMSRAETAGHLHAAAGEQIDAADYALRLLHDDISHLMIFGRDVDEELNVRRYPKRPGRAAAVATPSVEVPAHAAA
jgi:hypothetical protein